MLYSTNTVRIDYLCGHLDIRAQDGWVLKTILPLPSKDMNVIFGNASKDIKGTLHSHFLVIMEKEG
jgi:hypothetical protein